MADSNRDIEGLNHYNVKVFRVGAGKRAFAFFF